MSTPEAQVVARSQAALAERILASLSEDHRDVLVLFELEQLSGEEISELLGIRVSAVWVRLHRAREAFSKHHDRLTRKARQ
jgi:RNA polymerase sigma-70 factor (ECF subfamily)